MIIISSSNDNRDFTECFQRLKALLNESTERVNCLHRKKASESMA